MLTRLRRFARRHPRLRGPARRAYGSAQYWQVRLLARLRGDPLRPLWVDPRAIAFTINARDPALTGNPVGHIGTTAGGDWDLGGVPVREHEGVYAILRARVEDGRDWREIPEYQANLARIERGELVDGAVSEAEYAARWAAIEALYERIKREGYRSQAQLAVGSEQWAVNSEQWAVNGEQSTVNYQRSIGEVRVQIGRRGELLFEEGLHRLAIARLLELPQIPVLVTQRHAQWAELREAVRRIVLQRGFFHQPFGHPDLDCLNAWFGNELAQTAVYGEERWDYIREAIADCGLGIADKSEIRNPQPTILDIGAYFGYFCHRFEELGFAATAVEPNPLNLDVLRRWRAIQGRSFAVREMSIFDLRETRFDIVLALNIFHHFVRTREEYERLAAFLERLACRAMFFEPDSNEGVESYRHFNDEDFVDFVLAHSGLSQARLLGRAKEGRGVYLLT